MSDWVCPARDNCRVFRSALGCFATGIAVVTSVTADGEKIGLTINSFNSVSLEPPLILFSIARQAYSLQQLLQTGHFAVNVLSASQQGLAERFAQALSNKWEGVEYAMTASGCPYFANVLGVFDCRIRNDYDGGDHIILVSEVVSLRVSAQHMPLLYYRGNYTGLK